MVYIFSIAGPSIYVSRFLICVILSKVHTLKYRWFRVIFIKDIKFLELKLSSYFIKKEGHEKSKMYYMIYEFTLLKEIPLVYNTSFFIWLYHRRGASPLARITVQCQYGHQAPSVQPLFVWIQASLSSTCNENSVFTSSHFRQTEGAHGSQRGAQLIKTTAYFCLPQLFEPHRNSF